MQPAATVLTFDDVARLALALGERVRDERVDALLVIARGGLVVGGILAYHLGIREVLVASVASYDAAGEASEPVLGAFPDDAALAGRRVLVVDEVWESGRTISAVVARVRAAGAEPVTAVLHWKPARSRVPLAPDHHVVEVDGWVTYPWTTVAAYLAAAGGDIASQ